MSFIFQVKKGIKQIRLNITNHLWNFTQEQDALIEDNFTMGAQIYLQSFEKALLDAMNKDGWDGIEDAEKLQWTTTGALFYSIIVITTIGEFSYVILCLIVLFNQPSGD